MSLPSQAQYVIAGAGIHGLSTAWRLAERLTANGESIDGRIVIVDKADKPKTVDNTEISLWERDGGYYRFRYNCIKSVMEYNPRTNQVIAIDKITTHIKNNVNTVVLLSGDPGTGKSMIPLLIAKQLGYSCVDTFNPTDPGDTMVNLFNIVNPTKKKKLII